MTEVAHVAPGQKVSADGIYSIPIEHYHGDCTEGPGLSSSGMRTIIKQSPAHYFAESYLNPKRKSAPDKEHFNIGRAAHTLLLGEAGFRKEYAIRPAEWSDWRTNAAKAWRDEQKLAGKTVLVPSDIDAIRGMAESLAHHPLIGAGLLQGEVERSLIFKDRTGVWVRSRPDVIPTADGVFVDLKTTGDAAPDEVHLAVRKHGYNVQGAVISMAAEAVLDIQMTSFVLAFVEKEPPYAVTIVPVDAQAIYYGRCFARKAIDTFARCVETGEWPAYEGEHTYYVPEWERKRLDEDIAAGVLPRGDAR
ncbi:PD-(D/E)XK nuclease-like domain-containing protein [Ancylobacter defluvii]|uniref:Putative exodeoxyribonuclease 8 PDDEXK-like domain-containing protein n=1 Tax=Ancylobacter defluvii TaxID=1282440 RepID=A0A9W6K446_9HYPH|nr:PD-(D/E)XK nuclease-like domain-containing protein [Ancylobacter defluvii]MBS7588252.1 PD-(D/E)XK nuclease-like domain-containing protein [Ancylobacter defluvii]GLK86648.1 hypothetical protein GCM10017653_47180 [Ancylobacter defluvii]